MSDDELVRLRPRHLAVMWGTAFGQLVDLWRAWFTMLMETGSGEDSTIVSDECSRISVPPVRGGLPNLTARHLVGISFGKRLDGGIVTFTQRGPDGSGRILVDACIDESKAPEIQGDIYQGQVVDEAGAVVATIALDAGS